MRIESNSICADCSDPCAVNVNVTHFTFVCANCAVVHRELGHVVKNMATDTFSQDEIDGLQSATNSHVNQVWLAKWALGEPTIDHATQRLARRHYLECKYRLQKWYVGSVVPKPCLCAHCEYSGLMQVQEPLSQSDLSTDVSEIGSPLPQMPMEQAWMGPMMMQGQQQQQQQQQIGWMMPPAPAEQIGRRPPDASWQTMQRVSKREQRMWTTPSTDK
jgi:hypothetical protein